MIREPSPSILIVDGFAYVSPSIVGAAPVVVRLSDGAVGWEDDASVLHWGRFDLAGRWVPDPVRPTSVKGEPS